jgi:hypothetical protein
MLFSLCRCCRLRYHLSGGPNSAVKKKKRKSVKGREGDERNKTKRFFFFFVFVFVVGFLLSLSENPKQQLQKNKTKCKTRNNNTREDEEDEEEATENNSTTFLFLFLFLFSFTLVVLYGFLYGCGGKVDGKNFKWRKLKSKAKYEECSSSCTNFGFLIYSFNPNRILVGLAIIKLLSSLSIFERNLLHEVSKRRKFKIPICTMSKVLEKT